MVQVKKLCRPEWAAIRRLMGRPRRLSPHFLLQEREKLYRYREDIRLVQQGRVRGTVCGVDMGADVDQQGICVVGWVDGSVVVRCQVDGPARSS